MRHSGRSRRIESINSRAEPYVVVAKDDASNSRANAVRTAGSSSTMATLIGAFGDICPSFGQTYKTVELPEGPTCRPPLGPVCRDNSYLVCKADQIGHALYAEFRHHSPAMDFHRLFDNDETCGDLLVEPTGNDVLQYFPLSMCQCGKTVAN